MLHGSEHLRDNHKRTPVLSALSRNLLLRARKLCQRHRIPQISSGDHDLIAVWQQLPQMLHSLQILNFCENADVPGILIY